MRLASAVGRTSIGRCGIQRIFISSGAGQLYQLLAWGPAAGGERDAVARLI